MQTFKYGGMSITLMCFMTSSCRWLSHVFFHIKKSWKEHLLHFPVTLDIGLKNSDIYILLNDSLCFSVLCSWMDLTSTQSFSRNPLCWHQAFRLKSLETYRAVNVCGWQMRPKEEAVVEWGRSYYYKERLDLHQTMFGCASNYCVYLIYVL